MSNGDEMDKEVLALAEQLSLKIQQAKERSKLEAIHSERSDGPPENLSNVVVSYDSLRKQKTESQNRFYESLKEGSSSHANEVMKHWAPSNIFKPRSLRQEYDIVELPDFDNYQLCKIDVVDKLETGTSVASSILANWGCSKGDIEVILLSNKPVRLRLECISYILNIHASLQTMFDNPANQSGFMSMANHDDFFSGRTPLSMLQSGNLSLLRSIAKYLDSIVLR